MSTLSTQPYKGTRDYYPADKRVQNYIFATWRKVVERHGYEEYAAPMLEPLELYTAKSGQELASEQTYTFTDRGDRVVAIRPEMTPSISRMVAARRQELGYPARLYSIANFMRYERPQRGREREFWQLNTDIFGVEGVHAESEIIGLAYDVVKAFGASDDMFVLRVNNRKLINYMMSQYLGLDAVQSHLMVKLFDRKNKIPAETFRDQAIDILGEEYSGEGVRKIAKLIAAKSMADLPEELKQSDAVVEVQELFTLLKSAGVQNAVFDITLMRGLDYYTGTVFEVFDTHPDNNRSMFGGGRYDGLVGLFGVEAVPTVGMAPGATMFQHFLESHKLLPVLSSTTDVCIVVPSQEGLEGALNFSRKLREEGVNVEVDITGRKIDKQIKSVLKKNVPFMIFVGNEEIKDELYVLKDIASDTEERLSFERVVSKVRARRGAQQDDEFAFFE
ncbi:MAG: Histidine-tRNA ligase [Candidatus Saccharibacteria bacterium GW2011_GWC2_48_9]|nr:MAG: Histidine-tRNA ligase [Candidatus Saccharibacteria bacterium GW2011_GWC2_48_9]